jgi:DNA helicase-2/ATP-dependent DNA helicase PcrA
VAHVLPALGVERVAARTFEEWAAEQRARHFPQLPGEARADTPAAVQRLKLHPALEQALAEQVRRVPGPATPEQALDDWASARTQPGLLAEVFGREAGGGVRPSALASFVDWNRRQNEDLFRALEGEDEPGAVLDAEDDALLLRAWQLRVGPLRGPADGPLRYRHLAIDEVQDFSPLEVRVLLDCLAEPRSLTLAGDTQQQLQPNGFRSWADFLGRLGIPGDAIETLRVSYRSSREILAFGRSLLGGLAEDAEPPAATRKGPPVELFRFGERGACVAFLSDVLRRLAAAEPLASVAVLCPSAELSALYHEGLAAGEVPSLRRVENQDFRFAPGVEVTELEQARGLEFDYVVVVDATEEQFPDTPAARRRLHVAATRAVHQLWLTCVGRPSALLRDLS